MTDQQKKYKEIVVAFATYDIWHTSKSTEDNYFDWLLTEEGKRLTAEEPEPGVIQGIWAVPEEKHRAAMEAAGLRNKAEESCIILLQKVVAQLDRIEGSMKFEPKDDTLWDEQEVRKRTRKE